MGTNGDAPRPAQRVFDFVFALAAMFVPGHELSRLKPRETGVISEESRGLVGVALAQWRTVAHKGDERWNEAFATLAEVFMREQYIDVRLYMYQLSDDAAALFRAYEEEHFSE